MNIKVYKHLLVIIALLLTGTISYGEQITPTDPAPVEPLLAVPVPDSISNSINHIDYSKMQLKMDNLNKIDWNKQTLAMQKTLKKVQEKMDAMSDRISKEIEDNIASKNYDQYDYDTEEKHQNWYNGQSQDDNAQKVKTYSKSYPADANDELHLHNAYGRITINTWAKNEVKVDIQIKGFASNDNDAQNTLGTVRIDDSKEGNVIDFKTNINQHSGFWNWGSNNRKVEVNYTVYMPAKLQLEVSNSYGSIILPDLSGQVKIRAAYTAVTAQRLSNPLSEISSSYGNVKATEFAGGRISMAYGDINIAEANNIKANVSYGSVNLGQVKGTINMHLAYVGRFKIAEVDESLKNLNINSAYSDLNLGISNRSSFGFDIIVTNASFDYDDSKVTITNRTPEPGARGYNPTKTYRGTFGKGNPDARVTITSAYGSVKFD